MESVNRGVKYVPPFTFHRIIILLQEPLLDKRKKETSLHRSPVATAGAVSLARRSSSVASAFAFFAHVRVIPRLDPRL